MLSICIASTYENLLKGCVITEMEESRHITILGTSDMHGNIWGYFYEDNKETDNDGMARLFTYIESVRKENPNTVLVDAGDDIQGTIMTDDLCNLHPDEEHPVISAMNAMGYDAMTIGNHEFNWGTDTVKKILSQANFPVLAANVLNPDGSYFTGHGWLIVEKNGIRIAIIGVVTPNVPMWDAETQGVGDLTFLPANEAVRRAINEIAGRADIIMVSAHLGIYPEFDEEHGSDSGQKIIDDNPEIAVLQVAHNHVIVRRKEGNTLVGGVRNGGWDIARFDIYLGDDGRIADSDVEIVSMAGIEPSGTIRGIPAVQKAHKMTIEYVNGGGSGEEGGASLGSTTAEFQPENEIRDIPEGKIRDTAVMDLINNIQLAESGADVSASALFKNTSNLPAGNINYGNIFSIYKFDNTLYRVTVTGAELKAYMEWSVSCFNQWHPGDINISFDPDYPDFLYDMFQGVDYDVDLSEPKGFRIKNVLFRGNPLQDDDKLKLAVNNYRYSSALKGLGLISGKRDWVSSRSIRDMIVDYFAKHSPVAPSTDNNWRITGINLSLDDPRRKEIIDMVNKGWLDSPYYQSYNLSQYDSLMAKARAKMEKSSSV